MYWEKEVIYDLLNGAYSPEHIPDWAAGVIENEFAPGKPCTSLYQNVIDANQRICARLGVDEDKDVENIINSMFDIAQILAYRMFDYGAMAHNKQ